jgi:hypothetical protein
MFAAEVALEVGIVGAGVIVVLVTMFVAQRPRRPDAGADDELPVALEYHHPPVTPPGAPAPRTPHDRDLPAGESMAPPYLERRTLRRAPVVRRVLLRRDAGERAEQRTFAMDVSVGGLLLAGPSDLVVGELLHVSLDLDQPIDARARVVRETADGMKGVAFETIAEEDRDRLERFVKTDVADAPGQPG